MKFLPFRHTRRSFLALVPAFLMAQQQRLVLMDHDGGMPDDYLAAALLLTMNHIRTLGIVVTPGDCYITPGVSATRKILDLMNRSDVTVTASTVRGLNPFPRLWRRMAFSIDQLPILNERAT